MAIPLLFVFAGGLLFLRKIIQFEREQGEAHQRLREEAAAAARQEHTAT